MYNLINDMKTEVASKHAELDKSIEVVEEKYSLEELVSGIIYQSHWVIFNYCS